MLKRTKLGHFCWTWSLLIIAWSCEASLAWAQQSSPSDSQVRQGPSQARLGDETGNVRYATIAVQSNASFDPANSGLEARSGEGSDEQSVTFSHALFENLTLFVGLDGSKQPQDFGVNAEFGGRFAANWGFPIIESLGIGGQIGTAIDATGDAVQVAQRTLGTEGRTQSFTTVGLFQRTEAGLNWGVVYDFLYEDYYDRFSMGQWRLDLEYRLSQYNTIGVWSAISDHGANGDYGMIPVTLTPITQTNAFINHTWEGNIQTMCWGGLANGHGQVNAVLGDLPRLENTFVFGSQIFVPLTDKLAIFGQGNFIMPAGSGTVDSYLGVVFYPYGGARNAGCSTFAPLQSVAAPTNFAVDLHR